MSFFRAIALSSIIGSSFTQAATLVTVESASSLLINPARSSPAIVVSLNQSNIPAQTSGVINTLVAKVGDRFKQGETIATVDCVDNVNRKKAEVARFSQAKSQLLFNQRELERGKKLLKQKNIGEAELDRISSTVDTARSVLQTQIALVDMAVQNVNRCHIKSPYHGVVTKRIASVGEIIEYGKPVVEMTEVKGVEVSAKISNSDEQSFKAAESFVVDVSGQQYKVTLRTLLPVIQSNTRSREARFVFSDNTALAGSTGRLRWQSPMSYLPAHLLLKRDGKNGYFIVENDGGKNTARFIAVGSAEEGRPLRFNAATGTQIVTDGRHGLNDGDDVELIQLNANGYEDKS